MKKNVELIWDEELDSNYFVREAFNSLRVNILFSGKHVKTIVVTSCYAHEGKSSVAFDLCRNLADSGKKVLLVDADLRKSVLVTRYTKEKGLNGLSEILSGQVETEDAIYQTHVEGLDIVFAGTYPPNPTELVGSPAFKDFLDGQRNHYDYIIIDAPPLGLVIDAAMIAGMCDGAVLVINIGHVKYRVAQGVKAQIEKSGCKILGVVLNQVDRKRSLKTDHSYYAAYVSGSYGEYADGGKVKQDGHPHVNSFAEQRRKTATAKQPQNGAVRNGTVSSDGRSVPVRRIMPQVGKQPPAQPLQQHQVNPQQVQIRQTRQAGAEPSRKKPDDQ